MNFLKRTKPIKLNFYTDHTFASEYFKPTHARNYKPEWLSKIEPVSKQSIKGCYGLRQTFANGFVIPLWTDITKTTQVDNDQEVEVLSTSDMWTQVEMPDLNNENNRHVDYEGRTLYKIHSPWVCHCDEDIDFVMMENMFSQAPFGVEFFSGVIQWKYQSATHMFMYLHNDKKQIKVEAGTIPFVMKQLSERKLEINCSFDPDKTYYYRDMSAKNPIGPFSMAKLKSLDLLNKRLNR